MVTTASCTVELRYASAVSVILTKTVDEISLGSRKTMIRAISEQTKNAETYKDHNVGPNIGIVELAADETLRVKDSVMGAHHDLIHCVIADKQLSAM